MGLRVLTIAIVSLVAGLGDRSKTVKTICTCNQKVPFWGIYPIEIVMKVGKDLVPEMFIIVSCEHSNLKGR